MNNNLQNNQAVEIAVSEQKELDFPFPFHFDTPVKKLTIKCDGLCEPNPGGIGTWAFVVYNENGESMAEDYGEVGEGEGITNNVAEYRAVIEALYWLTEQMEHYEVEILSDSQLVVNQINGDWACHVPHLEKLCTAAYELLELLNVCDFKWIPRTENKAADALTRLAYRKALRERQGKGND